MTKEEIFREQMDRGVVESAMRTKYSNWVTADAEASIFELETPIFPIDKAISENLKSPGTVCDYDYAFCLTVDVKYVDSVLSRSLKEQILRKHLSDLLEYKTITHAIYRVRLTPDRLVLSVYMKQPGSDGVGFDLTLLPKKQLSLWITYPASLRDKADSATIRFYPSPGINQAKGLIRLEEYQHGDGNAGLVRVVESAADPLGMGYYVQVQKKERVKV